MRWTTFLKLMSNLFILTDKLTTLLIHTVFVNCQFLTSEFGIFAIPLANSLINRFTLCGNSNISTLLSRRVSSRHSFSARNIKQISRVSSFRGAHSRAFSCSKKLLSIPNLTFFSRGRISRSHELGMILNMVKWWGGGYCIFMFFIKVFQAYPFSTTFFIKHEYIAP